MNRVAEFYSKKQRLPAPPERSDPYSGQSTLESRYNILWEEYMALKEITEQMKEEQAQLLQQLLIEIKEVKLHLIHISNESVTEEDIDD